MSSPEKNSCISLPNYFPQISGMHASSSWCKKTNWVKNISSSNKLPPNLTAAGHADRMFKLSCTILNLTSFLTTQLKDWSRYAINGTSFAAYLVLDLCAWQERTHVVILKGSFQGKAYTLSETIVKHSEQLFSNYQHCPFLFPFRIWIVNIIRICPLWVETQWLVLNLVYMWNLRKAIWTWAGNLLKAIFL